MTTFLTNVFEAINNLENQTLKYDTWSLWPTKPKATIFLKNENEANIVNIFIKAALNRYFIAEEEKYSIKYNNGIQISFLGKKYQHFQKIDTEYLLNLKQCITIFAKELAQSWKKYENKNALINHSEEEIKFYAKHHFKKNPNSVVVSLKKEIDCILFKMLDKEISSLDNRDVITIMGSFNENYIIGGKKDVDFVLKKIAFQLQTQKISSNILPNELKNKTSNLSGMALIRCAQDVTSFNGKLIALSTKDIRFTDGAYRFEDFHQQFCWGFITKDPEKWNDLECGHAIYILKETGFSNVQILINSEIKNPIYMRLATEKEYLQITKAINAKEATFGCELDFLKLP